MGKLKLAVVFVAAAIVSGSVTLAPRAFGYYRMFHAAACKTYNYAWGLASDQEGDLQVSQYGTMNTGYNMQYLICPDWHDSNTWHEVNGFFPDPKVRLRFYRANLESQVPRIQLCGRWGCSSYIYADSSVVGDVLIDTTGGPWWPGDPNSIFIPLDPINNQWGLGMSFSGYSVGDEFGPEPFHF
jgi:hypothetical protein